MKKIYIFDVDGTLTPSRRRMTEDFEQAPNIIDEKNDYYVRSHFLQDLIVR